MRLGSSYTDFQPTVKDYSYKVWILHWRAGVQAWAVEEEEFLVEVTGARTSATGLALQMARRWTKYILIYYVPTG